MKYVYFRDVSITTDGGEKRTREICMYTRKSETIIEVNVFAERERPDGTKTAIIIRAELILIMQTVT